MTVVQPHLWIAKDASQIGAGGIVLNIGTQVLREHLMQLFWDERTTAEAHINEKEIIASAEMIIATVRRYDLYNLVIGMLDDNIVSITYYNKQGGRHRYLWRTVCAVTRWLLRRNIILVGIYIKSKSNFISDHQSRVTAQACHNWRVKRATFRAIEALRCDEGFDVDCFAAARNNQTAFYFAYYLDPYAAGHNFFAQDLRAVAGNLWCFPPPSLLGNLLQYLRSYDRNAAVVAPAWVDQPWWPILLSGATALPLILDRDAGHFEMAHGLVDGIAPIEVQWNWIVVSFSPRAGESAAFRRRLPRPWSQANAAISAGMTALGRISPPSSTTHPPFSS